MTRLMTALGVILAITIWLSYQPVIYLGQVSGTNLEISLSQVGIAIFTLGTLGFALYKKWLPGRVLALFKTKSGAIINGAILAYPVFATISLSWTDNLTRGLLITVLAWAVAALWFSLALYQQGLLEHNLSEQNLKNYRTFKIIERTGLIATIVTGLFALFQLFGDALGVSPALTLLTEPYRYDMFGFARPTGFSAEPEFFASILLLPIFYCFYLELRKKGTVLSRLALVLATTVFFTTISRGACLALASGLAVIIAANFRHNLAKISQILAITAGAFVLAISLNTFAAAINTRDAISGPTATIMTINQLTLGVFDIPLPAKTAPEPPHKQKPTNAPKKHKVIKNSQNNGYVAESTNSRLLMSSKALDLWTASTRTILFGIGIGSFGVSLHNIYPSASISSIVNNQFLEVLTETGLIGLILFITPIIGLAYLAIRRKQWFILALVVAFSVQWCFFSGSINVLHIWVFYGLAAFWLLTTAKNKHLLYNKG